MRYLLLTLLICALTCVAHAAEPAIGSAAPGALGLGRDGKAIALEQHRGKIVVVTFWASWCTYCLKELPVLDAIQKQAGEHVQVIAVNVEDSVADYRMMMRQMRSFSLLQSRDTNGQIAAAYGVSAYPNLWIIDRAGRISSHHRGYGEWSLDLIVDEINRTFRESKPAPEVSPASTGATAG